MAKAGSGVLYAEPSLQFRVQWALSMVDDVNFYVQVQLCTAGSCSSGDFATIGTTTTGATSFIYTHWGYVQNGPWYLEQVPFRFKVQVIRKSDGAVVAESIADELPIKVGQCNNLV